MSVESTDPTPNHQSLPDDEFDRRIEDLRARYADCDLCAYDCRVDRTAGRVGTCQVDDTAYVSSYFPHFGEEECLKGRNGSGTIFLANCRRLRRVKPLGARPLPRWSRGPGTPAPRLRTSSASTSRKRQTVRPCRPSSETSSVRGQLSTGRTRRSPAASSGTTQTLSNLAWQANAAASDVYDWVGEERRTRQAISENVMDEFEARQSLGDIEEKADQLELRVDQEVTERKLIAGIDLTTFPGIDEAQLVGADVPPHDEGFEPIDVERRDPVEGL